MDGELLSLKWNNHRTTFLNTICNLREKASYADATLACDGKFYPVHRLVLSTCSEYFSAIFDNTPCKSPVVVLKDIECKNLEFLLNYMYIGEVSVGQSELAALIKAAECLRIKGLAVPDEEPVRSKRSDSSRNSSPPAKRRRHVHHSEDKHSRKSSNSGEDRLSSVPVESDNINLIEVKEEPQDHSVSEFDSGALNESGVAEEDSVGGPGDPDTDSANDFNSFFKSSVEKTEPVHIADYDSSDFPGPSGVQNNSLPPWESDNFQSDSLSGALSSPGSQQQDQQQQQQMVKQWLEQLVRLGGWDKLTCPVCGKVCSRSDKLKLHLRVHTGERPYCCTYCNHRSRTSDDLKRHIRTHTGERPYQCPFCPYKASDPSTIRSHKKTRHPLEMQALRASQEAAGLSSKGSSSKVNSDKPSRYLPLSFETLLEPRFNELGEEGQRSKDPIDPLSNEDESSLVIADDTNAEEDTA